MAFRPTSRALRNLPKRTLLAGSATPPPSNLRPRHLLSIADLTTTELSTLVLNARYHKKTIKSGHIPKALHNTLQGKTVAMMFNKRSTRTRVSTEAAVTQMGGTPMFLGKDDIQLGVNESLHDTSVVISSMTSCMVARVGPHSDVQGLAQYSLVPVINALSNDYHPLQTIADYLTIFEAFPPTSPSWQDKPGLGFDGLKIAWIGDSNNVLFDLAIGARKLGVDISVASPAGYGIPPSMRDVITSAEAEVKIPGKLTETTVPEEAIKGASIIVTDTWVSMGQEEETIKRMKAFEGFQITKALIKRGRPNTLWKFMHCLPRHPEEVADEVFYGPKSLVFTEAENRLWAAIAALEGFVVNKGNLQHSRQGVVNGLP